MHSAGKASRVPKPDEKQPKGDPFYELRRTLALAIYKLAGWRFAGDAPSVKKVVVIAAPHTSNWDLPLMLASGYKFRVKLKWMGKDQLFKGPFGGLMKAMGGIPIDRSKANNIVSQMIDIYHQNEELAVAIPPEGTRAKVPYWKTGFYNIAHGAGVPIVLGFLDYDRKIGGIGGEFITTGDYEADLEEIKKFYAKISAKFQERYGQSS